MNEQKYTGPERRRKKDWMIRAATGFTVFAWLSAVSMLLVLDVASPNQANMFTHYFSGRERADWNDVALLFAYIFLVFSFVASVVAFIFNMVRMRRKTDRIRISTIVIGALTLFGLVGFILRFGSAIF